MMLLNPRKASGRASALRVSHTIAPTASFKTRCPPCRIAVRAELGRSVNSDDQWAKFGGIFTSLGGVHSAEFNRMVTASAIP